MHRPITAALVVGLLLLAMAVPAVAVEDITGPDCRDITLSVNYTTEGSTPTVSFLFETPTATCRGVRYSGYVLDSAGFTRLAWGSTAGDGDSFGTGPGDELGLFVAVASGPGTVCVYGTSSSGPRVWDRAPDTGCVTLTLDDEGAGAQRFG